MWLTVYKVTFVNDMIGAEHKFEFKYFEKFLRTFDRITLISSDQNNFDLILISDFVRLV